MDRRGLLKNVGLGTLAATSLPTVLAACQAAAGQTTFHFVCLSQAGTVDGVKHRVVLIGDGKFTGSSVEGGGGFLHFNDAPEKPPKPVLAQGAWKATKFVSWKEVGRAEPIIAGILEMQVDLAPQGKPAVTGATLKVVCNIGPAGIQTGQMEGVELTIPGAPQGAFKQIEPMNVGLTAFTIGV